MSDSLEILKEINWILKPVSNAILFLFSTKTGVFILLLVLTLYIFFTVVNALRVRSLLHSRQSGETISPNESIFIVISEISKIFLRIITNIPVILGVLVLLFIIVGMSSGLQSIDEYISNEKKIKELQTVLKHLDSRFKVAEITIDDYNPTTNKTDLSIKFFDNTGAGYVNKTQKFSIAGKDIYFDALVLNFDYSQISSGLKKNIAIPYRIFSEAVAMDNGIRIDLKDENGVPFIFHRKKEQIYGLTPEKYNERIKELSEFFTNAEAAKSAGIRSIVGNAVHKIIKKGDVFIVWIEQTGGLVIKDEVQF